MINISDEWKSQRSHIGEFWFSLFSRTQALFVFFSSYNFKQKIQKQFIYYF